MDLLPNSWPNMGAEERRQYLSANADQISPDEQLTVRIEPEQRRELKETLAEKSIELSMLEDEYQQIKDFWTEKLKPHKKEVKDKLEKLKTGFESVVGTTYHIRDHEEGMLYILLEDGTVYDKRPLFQHERQGTIHNINSKTS